MIDSIHYTSAHEAFRERVKAFLVRECLPHLAAWQDDRKASRSMWHAGGAAGLLCPKIAPEWGGGGGNLYHCFVILEEQMRGGFSDLAFYLHSDIIAPYIELYGTEDQRQRFLPRMATGELVAAIAMTEPGAGSDLQAIRTRARRDGDDYLISGQKIFITNAQNAELVIVAAKTDPEAGGRGVSLFILETAGADGYSLGRNLEKVGCKLQDASELFFDNVRVPAQNLLGGVEGRGFYKLMQRLPEERLIMAMAAVTNMECAIDETITFAKARKTPGGKLIDQPHTRLKLAEAKSTATIARAYLEGSIDLFIENRLDANGGAIKWWTTEKCCEVLDECLQLYGDFGPLDESPVAQRWADARLGRIAGGSNEVMKDLIGRSL